MASIIVIGRNYTSRLGMIRALGKAGHEITVIKTNGHKEEIDAKSKYVKEYLYAQEPNRSLLIERIMAQVKKDEKTILVPVDDYAASTIDENIDILSSHFLFPNIEHKQGAITHLMDKDVQKDLAIKAGLPVAKGWTIEIKDGNFSIPSDISYPCFPKPQISFLGSKSCMKKCDNEEELKSIIKQVAKISDCPLLVEQYITIEKEYGVLGLCNGDVCTVPGLVDKVLIGNGHHKGVTKVGIVTPLSNNKELHEKLKRFLNSIGFTGLCDIDLYESNGVIYFNELNLRFGAFGYSILCAGANLPELFVKTITGEKVDYNDVSVAEKTTCLSEKVNFQDFTAGYYGLSEYKRINKMADKYFIQDPNDNKPYEAFIHGAYISAIKSSIKLAIKRIIRK